MNQRQFTLSYRLLPLNRRNAAQNGPRERLADPSASKPDLITGVGDRSVDDRGIKKFCDSS